jgi:cysteine desulfurase / selenocysteine lyase
MYDLTQLRQTEFPLSADNIYFNHASISPIPARTQARMHWATDKLAQNPSRHFMEDGMPMFGQFMTEFAAFVNATGPEEIVPVTTTSAALNAVAQAIHWQPGDNFILADMEFPSNAYPWLSLGRDGVEARLAPSVGGGLTLAALEPFVDERTRLVAASAIQLFSGHRTDLVAIGQFCRERGILFAVDAIQAAGHIPLDVQAMAIDILAAGGQKSLLAPPGIGFLYVRQAICDQLQPRIIGPNATVNYLHWLDYDLAPLPGAQRFMAGTPNTVGMFGLLASLSLLQELGMGAIDRHTSRLAATAIRQLADCGYTVVTPVDAHGPIVTFASGLDLAATDALVAELARQNIFIVKHLDKAGRPHIRLSFHCYNTEAELARFMTALSAL